ncbi:LAME_0F05732g1_1 [Lachancea meyersii CBS 8951]|uniref:LAME_0F05732g1_1 n=1 Tax=Lachancea meyersii CBS 8951 TaxID=1266667 RepID=A0A1G4JSX8_9SACH|nr:LAME_0F05732g1_1 [Lachancea meyersii CBS 8951]
MTSLPRQESVASSLPSNSGVTTEIDRRRRDNLNDKMQTLLKLIPEELFQEYYRRKEVVDLENGHSTPGSAGVPAGGSASGSKLKGTGTKDGKPNKGQILTQAVEYMTKLQAQVDARNREEVELILRVKELSKKTGVAVNDINLENTSAEIALARIGVGPLAGMGEEMLDNAENAKDGC